MDEYIRREALIEHIKDLPTWWADGGGIYPGSMKYPDGMYDPEDIVSSIKNAPAADVAPVVHGRLEVKQGNYMTEDIPHCLYYKCNTCGRTFRTIESFNYCSNCGAKLDGKEKNNG